MQTGLPQDLYRFFWEVDPAKIDLEKNKKYVIERLLQWGGEEAWKWLGSEFDTAEIVAVLKQNRSLPRRDAKFYATVFELKPEEVLCLNPAWRGLHRQIWQH